LVFRDEKYEIVSLEDESQNKKFLKIKARKFQ
ncbi:phage head completion protein, partial [Campylobacter jejuni]